MLAGWPQLTIPEYGGGPTIRLRSETTCHSAHLPSEQRWSWERHGDSNVKAWAYAAGAAGKPQPKRPGRPHRNSFKRAAQACGRKSGGARPDREHKTKHDEQRFLQGAPHQIARS